MAESKGGGVPWGSLAILTTFISSVVLAPVAFEHLRPAETERASPVREEAIPLVDARLWEDPFKAVRRHVAEKGASSAAGPGSGAGCLDAADLVKQKKEAALAYWNRLWIPNPPEVARDTLVVAVMVAGNPFVGAEESRRRTRYALLAGFAAQAYLPDDSEHIGVWRPVIAHSHRDAVEKGKTAVSGENERAGCQVQMDIPVEMLSFATNKPRTEGQPVTHNFDTVALLWINEAELDRAQPTATLSQVFAAIFGAPPDCANGSKRRLAIIGPSDSDALQQFIAGLDDKLGETSFNGKSNCTGSNAPLSPTLVGEQWLAVARIFSNGATASDQAIPVLHERNMKAGAFFDLRFGALVNSPGEAHFTRTIATDAKVVKSLVNELQLRLSKGHRRRIVLVVERDSLYAQAQVDEIEYRLPAEDREVFRFEKIFYYRGIDGVTIGDGSKTNEAAKVKPERNSTANSAASIIEWPESRDQLDYLRRVAAALRDSESTPGQMPIGAIGIIGGDVHDKLLILQALHAEFPDKVFFTTDMDARYLHPRVNPFARNLIVASSLPLDIPPPPAPLNERGGAVAPPDIQAGTPPFRDVYQTATFLAAQLAVCGASNCIADPRPVLNEMLSKPSLYEIGRTRAVAIAGYDFERRSVRGGSRRAALAITLIALLSFAFLVWPSTPTFKMTRDMVLGRGQIDIKAGGLPYLVNITLQMSLFSFALGCAISFVEPGRLKPADILTLTAFTAAAAMLMLHPNWSCAAIGVDCWSQRLRRWILLALGAVAVVALGWPAKSLLPCVDCEPVALLEGISAWPSQLVNLVAITVAVFALDHLWRHCRGSMCADCLALGLKMPERVSTTLTASPVDATGTVGCGCGQTFGERWQKIKQDIFCISAGSPSIGAAGGSVDSRGSASVNFETVWHEYASQALLVNRAIRVAGLLAITLVVATLLFFGASEGYVLEVPVRGPDWRQLIQSTLIIALLALALLVVGVVDSTFIACRFITRLNAGRTIYSGPIIKRAALSLGSTDARLWRGRLAADAARRGLPGRRCRHSLLDNWLDFEIVARRTNAVAPLVICPFVVIALLLIARSRLFDGWALTWPVVVITGIGIGALIGLAAALKWVAETARSTALERMNQDLRWLRGAGNHWAPLVGPFEKLIAEVEKSHDGAFASLVDQPLFKAMLIPLGGAGGAQLLDFLLMAR